MSTKGIIITAALAGIVGGIGLQVWLGGTWWVMSLMSIMVLIMEDMDVA